MDQRRPSLLLLTAVLLAFTLSVLPVTGSPVADASDRCIDFELNKVDALTTLANGSIFLVHNQQYWVLAAGEVPSLDTARPISKLIGEVGGDKVQARETPTIEAAVTVRVKAQGRQCVPANQILLVSWVSNEDFIFNILKYFQLFS